MEQSQLLSGEMKKQSSLNGTAILSSSLDSTIIQLPSVNINNHSHKNKSKDSTSSGTIKKMMQKVLLAHYQNLVEQNQSVCRFSFDQKKSTQYDLILNAGLKEQTRPSNDLSKAEKSIKQSIITQSIECTLLLLTRQQQMHLLLSQQKTHNSLNKHKPFSQHKSSPSQSSINQSYMKIYQSYLKQKQLSTQQKHRIAQQQDEYAHLKQQEEDHNALEYLIDQSPTTKHGIKYYNVLQKHPKLLDLTISRKNQQQGFTLLQQRIKRKALLTEKIKKESLNKMNHNKSQNQNDNPQLQQFAQQKVLQQQKESKRYFENPQKVIERQLTKFYIKKNSGKLSEEAEHNQRSQKMIKRQKQINIMIDEHKISKENKKKLQYKLNDLANQLAKSDRIKSLQKLLPQLKQLKKIKPIASNRVQQHSIKRKLFSQNSWKQSLGDFQGNE